MTRRVEGLYAITPELTDTADLLKRVRSAVAGGASCVQYRNKTASPSLRQAQSAGLLEICRHAGACFIVNDDVALAAEINADGVHLGKDDGSVAEARRRLGKSAVIGVSCYNDLSLADQAVSAGADYVAFGSFFPSLTKPDAVRADLSLLRHARERCGLPIVAIGGIHLNNASPLIDAGATALAVINALFEAPDIERAAQQFNALFYGATPLTVSEKN